MQRDDNEQSCIERDQGMSELKQVSATCSQDKFGWSEKVRVQ